MNLTTGTILKSTAALNATVFEATTIIIAVYNSDGAIGFIINKPFHRRLNDLEEFKNTSFPLHYGGPVDQEHLFFIHRRPVLVEGGTRIAEGIYYGGNFSEVISSIDGNDITTKDVKIFIGYCGWDAGELEAEIEEGSWEIVEDRQATPIF